MYGGNKFSDAKRRITAMYIPGLYIKSENEPDKALDVMEERMICYEKEIRLLRKSTTENRYVLI